MDEAKDIAPVTSPPRTDASGENLGNELETPDPRRTLLIELTKRLADPDSVIRYSYAKDKVINTWTIIDSPDGNIHFSIDAMDQRPASSAEERQGTSISLEYLDEASGMDGFISFRGEPGKVPEFLSTVNGDPASPEFIERWKREGGYFRANSRKNRVVNKEEISRFTNLIRDGQPNKGMLEAAFKKGKRLPAASPNLGHGQSPTPTPLSPEALK